MRCRRHQILQTPKKARHATCKTVGGGGEVKEDMKKMSFLSSLKKPTEMFSSRFPMFLGIFAMFFGICSRLLFVVRSLYRSLFRARSLLHLLEMNTRLFAILAYRKIPVLRW